MTKKDFIEIADIINNNLNGYDEIDNTAEFKLSFIDSFSEWLKSKNPKFDEVKFKERCLKK